MGRSIISEEAVEIYIDKLIASKKWFVGVIIGQLTSQRDYVVHIAKTPDPVEDEVSEENGDDETGDGSTKQKPGVEHPVSLEQMDEKWVSTHAKQVSRMLPGGFSVVGLFTVAPPTMLKNSQGKLKQMMFAVHKHLNKNAVLASSGEVTDRILLQVDTATKRLTCITLDVANMKSTPRPAEWKFQSGGSRWVRLNAYISLDIPMAVPTDSKTSSLLKEIQGGLVNLCDTVQQSIVTIGGTIRDPAEPFSVTEKRNKGSKGCQSLSSEKLSQSINICLPFKRSDAHVDPLMSSSQATVNLMGTTIVRAYVSARATVSDAIAAIKMDVIRSLLARCELLCEEFDVTEEKQGSELYDPPVRLFCQLPHCNVEVCDYVFQDEKQEEVKQRIKELLDVEVDELEESEKSAADDDTWSCQSSLSCMSSHQSLVASSPDQKSALKSYIGAAVAGIIAFSIAWISHSLVIDE